MSLSDDEELDARLGALRADPPERGFSSRLRGALEAEAAAMGEVPPGEADLSHLDARLSALKVEPPDTGFGARLHTALERAKEEREPVFPYLQSWLVRAAIVLLAIFAPVALDTTVYHHWYFRSNSSKPFTHADRIPIKISGGREGGYRAYTFKQRLDPGDWRVDVETEDGRIVGRVSVKVEDQKEAQPVLRTVSY